jgi:bifunctional dethiobiotin synthetase / adenosylmethionine---8-amino-7-oxononanoate aminotransferase
MASSLFRNLKTHQIYASNTSTGKTILSTLFLRAHTHHHPTKKTFYLKPISTGPDNEADDRRISHFSPTTETKCLYQFKEAVSPHIAAQSSPPFSDETILKGVQDHLASCAKGGGTLLLETAGGVHSPTPSGSSQADLYRPLRLPVCLIADHRLGGISGTISAFESLHVRGYDLDAVCVFRDEEYMNYVYLREFFGKQGVKLVAVPQPPGRGEDEREDGERMAGYYESVGKGGEMEELISVLGEKHERRIEELEGMSTHAYEKVWYPFTQHKEVSPKTILTIDSASGDFFQSQSTTGEKKAEVLNPTFDGSASWWTQGLGHGNPDLSLAAAYAAGRYGHVMFADTIHEPALKLASNLLQNLNNPRLTKCFFSDNGSTGMEVATKMALTASCERYGWEKGEIGVLGLKGSYHGDTIGAMDCSEPSTFNERVHWYDGRGFWFDFPRVKMVKGEWVVEPPSGMEGEFGEVTKFGSLGDVFDLENRSRSSARERYQSYIKTTLERLVKEANRKFGALIMEVCSLPQPISGTSLLLTLFCSLSSSGPEECYSRKLKIIQVQLTKLTSPHQRPPLPTNPHPHHPLQPHRLQPRHFTSTSTPILPPHLDRPPHNIRRSLHRPLPTRPIQLCLLPPNTTRYLRARQTPHRRLSSAMYDAGE